MLRHLIDLTTLERSPTAIACNSEFVVIPSANAQVNIWRNSSLASRIASVKQRQQQHASVLPDDLDAHRIEPDLILEGHHRNITALCLTHTRKNDNNNKGIMYLCTASKDRILLWDLDSMLERDDYRAGTLLGENVGNIECVVFDRTDRYLAVCADNVVLVYDTHEGITQMQLEGHTSRIMQALFSSHHPNCLITISEDRTFKIWDLHSRSLMYQSSIISISPFVSIAEDPVFPRFVIGSADGKVRFYECISKRDGSGAASSNTYVRCLHTMDIHKYITDRTSVASQEQQRISGIINKGFSVVSSEPVWKQQSDMITEIFSGSATSEVNSTQAETVHSILALHYIHPATAKQAKDTVRDVFDQAPTLVIGTPTNVLHMDTLSYEIRNINVLATKNDEDQQLTASHYGFYAADKIGMKTTCVVANAFLPFAHIYEMDLADNYISVDTPVADLTFEQLEAMHAQIIANQNKQNQRSLPRQKQQQQQQQQQQVQQEEVSNTADEPTTNGHNISIFALSPLPEKLQAEFGPKKPADKKDANKKSKLKDKPVTFRTKIKSSGYGSKPPVMQLGGASTKKPAATKKSESSSSSALIKEYNVKCEPPVKPLSKQVEGGQAIHNGPIMKIAFSGDASRIASCSTDYTMRVMKLPITKYRGEGSTYQGHNAAVLSVGWSFDKQHLITSSQDCTACLWRLGRTADPILRFARAHNNLKEGTVQQPNPAFTSEIRDARFYYMDRFVVLASGSTLYLYKYYLDREAPSDLKRTQNNNRYKLAQSMTSASQSISSLSCVNSFMSNIILFSGTNKNVEVYDVAANKVVRVLKDAHSRPTHTVCVHESSPYTTHSSESYQLFLTASTDNCVKLWDLRTDKCVRRFAGHMNRMHTVGVSFSPCLRFIACGSEDRCAYLYDITSGTIAHKLHGQHSDVVSDVQWNPCVPQIATCSFDGKVKFYGSSESAL